MQHLWAPWRMEYIQGQAGRPPDGECVFCWAARQPKDGPENLVLFRGRHNYVILNRFPYTGGHLMIVPYEHVADLAALPSEVRSEMMDLASEAVVILRAEYHPQGFNLGMNLGRVAGAGIAEHVHLHVVPRWAGDTNFMTTVGQVRVLPEALEQTYQRLRAAWQRHRAAAA
ncbi:MAG: HIT domain-containing protein [Chloroflexi bacterium]|nr:HIT domain-containing protein [Chloroflexota bacterium]